MPAITYIAASLVAAVVALAVTPLTVRLARLVRIVDRPGMRKVHTTAVPRIGGLVLVVSLLAVVIPLLLIDNPIGRLFNEMQTKVIALLATSSFIFAVGFVDDARRLSPRVKLVAQIVAATVVCSVGIRIDHLAVAGWFEWKFPEYSWPLTVLWIVGITNAVNLIDGLDGLAAGISAVTCAVIAVFALYTHQTVMAVLMLTLFGSLMGFLVFNFNPARIFLGDCGSMFLGFFLATASVMTNMKSYSLVGLALPVVALGVPIFDTLFTMMRRTLDRRSIFAPDRGHIHHRIVDMGLRHRQAVILMYGATALAAGAGLFMMLTRHLFAVLVFVGALVPLVVMFRVFGAVRLREALASLQKNRAIAKEARQQQNGFEEMQMRLRETDNLDQWWRVMRRAARRLGLARMSVTVTANNDPPRTLNWTAPGLKDGANEMLRAAIPARFPTEGWEIQAEIEVPAGESLESAGRAVALFGRLIDEGFTAPEPAEGAGDEDN